MSKSVRRVGMLLAVVAMLLAAATAQATEYHGTVTFSGLPLPGATVTATQGEKKIVTSSGPGGYYTFADLPDGKWEISVEMLGFESMKQEVTVAASVAAGAWEMKMMSLAQIQAETKPVVLSVTAATMATGTNVPTASATVTAAKTTGKVTRPANSAQPNAPEPPPPPADDAQQARASDGLLINGSVTNAATSQFSQNMRFGNAVNNGRHLYSGQISLVFANPVLNASPYSLTGSVLPKPDNELYNGNFTFGGPIRIPHVVRNGPNFTIVYQWSRGSSATTTPSHVPDSTGQTSNDKWKFNTPVFNPVTHLRYLDDTITLGQQAKYLLGLYPKPNVTNSSSPYNYEAPSSSSTHQQGVQLRMNRSAGPRDNFNGNFDLGTTRISSVNPFNFVDKTNVLTVGTGVNWSHRFGQTFFIRNLFMTLGYQFTRQRIETRTNFEDVTNVSGPNLANITGNDPNPTNWGPPALIFAGTSQLLSLSDGIALRNRPETNAFNAQFNVNHGRHYFTVIGNLRRQEFNYFQQNNPRGSFTFTGAATQDPSNPGSGSDFADFIAGVPDASALATGNADKYLRQTVYSASITDDWRMRPELTLNLTLRWDYGAPMTELKQRLVNLDIAPDFSKATPVLASAPSGSSTGQTFPQSLIRPDHSRTNFSPIVGLSWRPIPGSSLVVHASAGLFHDTSVYQPMVLGMAQQAPLSKSLSVTNSAACQLTMQDGFRNCGTTTPQTIAVDPNFRIGYAQLWKADIQRDLPFALQMMVQYAGTRGVHGVQQFQPNTYPFGGTNPCPSCPIGFTYRTSGGNLNRHEGNVQLRRRLRSGFTATVLYRWAKSIDDDSLVGGQGAIPSAATAQSSTSLAQDWRNLRAERGLSSFDQRHSVTAQIQYTTGMGLHGGTLLAGWRGAAYREWTFLSDISAGTGLPLSPIYPAAVAGTGLSGSLRPNVTGADLYASPAGQYLNPSAFSQPATGVYGNARRNSITGPNVFTMNASMARTFRLKERYSMDARVDSLNVLNHVTYASWNTTTTFDSKGSLNNPFFGAAQAPKNMRTIQGTLRLRF